jgi:hypothetical protein
MDIQLATAIAVPAVTVLVWLVRLEGRVNTHDSILQDLRDDVREVKADVKSLLIKP